MIRAALLFCAVMALAKGETTNVSRCTLHSGPLPINTHIKGCVNQPCSLAQGTDAVVEIIFQAPRNMLWMRTAATAIVLFVPLPYDLGDNSHTCNFLTNSYCPVAEGEILKYTLRMPIEEFMPVGTLVPIEFRILDDNNVAIVCLRSQVRIIAGSLKNGAQNATMLVEEELKL